MANASHELRTPVTVGRALLEMILGDPAPTLDSFRSTCEEVLAAGEHQEELIEALLTLARSQRGLDHEERFDLAHVVGDVVEPFEEVATARGLTIQVAIKPTQIVGDLRLVERLVSNLVENALSHNVPNGRIDVAVRTRAGSPTLRVANTGPRVPRSRSIGSSNRFNASLPTEQATMTDLVLGSRSSLPSPTHMGRFSASNQETSEDSILKSPFLASPSTTAVPTRAANGPCPRELRAEILAKRQDESRTRS